MTTTQPMPTLAGIRERVADIQAIYALVAGSWFDKMTAERMADVTRASAKDVPALLAALDAVLALRDVWRADAAKCLATFGQHQHASLDLLADQLDAAISAHVALGSGEVR